jgi:drug/metabolite transporter (DMT)-like permease
MAISPRLAASSFFITVPLDYREPPPAILKPSLVPSNPNATKPISWRTALLSIAVSVSRGGNQVAIKFALAAFAPLWTAFARMFVSAIAVGIYARSAGIRLWPEPSDRRQLGLLGVMYTSQIALLHWGADLTSPAYAVTLINTNPIFANVIAHFFVPADRLTVRRILGLAIAFVGVSYVAFGRPDAALAPHPLLGNWVIIVSSFLVGVRTVYIQRIVQSMPSTRAVFWQLVFSVPCFAIGGWFIGDSIRGPFDWKAITAILYQGFIVGGLSLVLWVRLLKAHSPGRISVFSFTTPMSGLLLSSLFFGEQLTARLWLGLASVITGISLAAKPADDIPRP